MGTDVSAFSYESLCRGFDALAAQYDCVQRETLGISLCGREIPLVRLGHGAHRILYVSTHHGCEWLTAALLLLFAKDFCAGYQKRCGVCNIHIPYLVNTRTVYLVPVLNPDGTVLSMCGADERNPLASALLHGLDPRLYRGNGRGVDLNRNYDASFRPDPPTPGTTRDLCGMYPESEPETAALCRMIRRTQPFDLMLSLHTAGEEIYYDFEGRAGTHGRALAEILARLSGYPLREPPPHAAGGGLKDWYQTHIGPAAFTVECGRGETPLDPACLNALYQQLRPMLFTGAVLS